MEIEWKIAKQIRSKKLIRSIQFDLYCSTAYFWRGNQLILAHTLSGLIYINELMIYIQFVFHTHPLAIYQKMAVDQNIFDRLFNQMAKQAWKINRQSIIRMILAWFFIFDTAFIYISPIPIEIICELEIVMVCYFIIAA